MLAWSPSEHRLPWHEHTAEPVVTRGQATRWSLDLTIRISDSRGRAPGIAGARDQPGHAAPPDGGKDRAVVGDILKAQSARVEAATHIYVPAVAAPRDDTCDCS